VTFSDDRAAAERFLRALWGGAGGMADVGLFMLPGAGSQRVAVPAFDVAESGAVCELSLVE